MKVRLFIACALFMSLALAVQTAHAAPFAQVEVTDFMFVSESAVYDPSTQDVLFTIEFNQPLDFFSSPGQYEFQYFIVGDPSLSWPEKFDSIIRGGEITPDGLPIRNPVPSDPDPASGGWGSLRGVVPYQINGNVLTFSVPLQLLSDHSVDGNFDYTVESYQFGSLTNQLDSHSISPMATAQIDIKPDSTTNLMNLRSKGSVPVGILTTSSLDATTVDPLSVTFGPNGAYALEDFTRIEDVNHDGSNDLLLYFLVQDTGIACDMKTVLINGQTFAGQLISGTDSVRPVGCQKKPRKN